MEMVVKITNNEKIIFIFNEYLRVLLNLMI